MKAVGVVVEYNPFHNGHAYHIAESRKQADADLVIAVMSGPFLQRGEPALVSKWARAEMALASGADLVVELPSPFASQNAEVFARGAIGILEALGCDTFCFGSEAGDIEPFLNTVSFMKKNGSDYNRELKRQLKDGNSYPKAASKAFRNLSENLAVLDLSQPNNILGYEYVKTSVQGGFRIEPLTIRRVQAGYHDPEPASETIASATAIRNAISREGTLSGVQPYIPEASLRILEEYRKAYGTFHSWDLYWPFLKYRILSSSPEQLRDLYGVGEGLENRLAASVRNADSYSSFMERMKTKRYTWTRIQRLNVRLLLNTSGIMQTEQEKAPAYIRLLGHNGAGRSYLNSVKKQLGLPLISRLAAHAELAAPDIRAAEIYALGLEEPFRSRLMKREFGPAVMAGEK